MLYSGPTVLKPPLSLFSRRSHPRKSISSSVLSASTNPSSLSASGSPSVRRGLSSAGWWPCVRSSSRACRRSAPSSAWSWPTPRAPEALKPPLARALRSCPDPCRAWPAARSSTSPSSKCCRGRLTKRHGRASAPCTWPPSSPALPSCASSSGGLAEAEARAWHFDVVASAHWPACWPGHLD